MGESMSQNQPISSKLNVQSLQSLGLRLEPRKLSEEEIAAFQAFMAPRSLPPAPTPAIYATVEQNGKVVATLYKDGTCVTTNAAHARIRNLPSMGEGETLTGAELAVKRAQEIAKALGGRMVLAGPSASQSSASQFAAQLLGQSDE